MKLLLYLVLLLVNAEANVLIFVMPEKSPTEAIEPFFVSWFREENLIKRAVDENVLKHGINIEGEMPKQVMLRSGDNYVCTLNVLGDKVIIPIVKKVEIDVSSVSDGGILLKSIDEDDGFFHTLIGQKKLEIPMAENNEPIAIYFKKQKGGPISQIGTFSVGKGNNYHINISNKGDTFDIQVRFSP